MTGLCVPLAPAEQRYVRSWRPQQLGALSFNNWD